jgi:hypothetical protein
VAVPGGVDVGCLIERTGDDRLDRPSVDRRLTIWLVKCCPLTDEDRDIVS